MPRVSIVIVNYNVRYFLRQCLQSVLSSVCDAELEIIVVDNASMDGSVKMLTEEFPQVKCISNKENLGFSKANNQAFEIATGDYILILNPDTILEEQSIQNCIQYYQQHDNVGAIGVRMVDGSGQYLPESKRGFPTPLSSLFKMSGLSRVFKNSSFFNAYYLGHIPESKTAQMEVLSGAYIFTDKHTLNQIGGFDEDYFMYGEDIEMSYQIKALGKDIIYLPETTIIHFKGESTKKASFNYLKRFYGAMQIYSEKRHKSSSWIWKYILRLGILFAALSGFVKTLFKLLLWPVINLFCLVVFTKLTQYAWAKYYFGNPEYYSEAESDISIGILCLFMVACYYLFGHFDKRYRFKQWIFAALTSAFVLLSLYALFPLHWRFSRTVLIILLFASPFLMLLLRRIFTRVYFGRWGERGSESRRILTIGSPGAFSSIDQIVQNIYGAKSVHQHLNIESDFKYENAELADLVNAQAIDEIIFCSGDLTTDRIFGMIGQVDRQVDFKIASNDNKSILGSNSKNAMGEWYTLEIDFKLNQEFHKRTKRLIDLDFSILLILLFPIFIFSKNRKQWYGNLVSVLLGQKTWISYDRRDVQIEQLPRLRKGVFSILPDPEASLESIHNANLFYARHYSIWVESEKLLSLLF